MQIRHKGKDKYAAQCHTYVLAYTCLMYTYTNISVKSKSSIQIYIYIYIIFTQIGQSSVPRAWAQAGLGSGNFLKPSWAVHLKNCSFRVGFFARATRSRVAVRLTGPLRRMSVKKKAEAFTKGIGVKLQKTTVRIRQLKACIVAMLGCFSTLRIARRARVVPQVLASKLLRLSPDTCVDVSCLLTESSESFSKQFRCC